MGRIAAVWHSCQAPNREPYRAAAMVASCRRTRVGWALQSPTANGTRGRPLERPSHDHFGRRWPSRHRRSSSSDRATCVGALSSRNCYAKQEAENARTRVGLTLLVSLLISLHAFSIPQRSETKSVTKSEIGQYVRPPADCGRSPLCIIPPAPSSFAGGDGSRPRRASSTRSGAGRR